jgi:hypothetical protein
MWKLCGKRIASKSSYQPVSFRDRLPAGRVQAGAIVSGATVAFSIVALLIENRVLANSLSLTRARLALAKIYALFDLMPDEIALLEGNV